MVFSKRLVVVYTLIVVIPLFVLVCIISVVVQTRRYNELRNECVEKNTENVNIIKTNLVSYNLIESMINANSKLMFFLTSPENETQDELIETLQQEVLNIERIVFVAPEIYSIRVFANNNLIPERWPVLLNVNRLSEETLKRWTFNYRADFMGNLNALKDESVCTTRPLIRNRRDIGCIQTSMLMKDFFPFLYNEKHLYDHDYVFSVDVYNDKNRILQNFQQIENKDILAIQKPFGTKYLNILINKINQTNEMQGVVSIREGMWVKFCSWHYIPDIDIVTVHTISGIKLWQDILSIIIGVFLSLCTTVVILYLIIRYTTSHLMSGVYSVMDGMKRVKEGDFNVQIKVEGTDEVSESQQIFNSMTDQLNHQIVQIKQEQSLIADTEMKAMQNQINAHFLYNVLETIRMQAVLKDQDDIAESILVLGKMMRYCLRWRIHRVSLEQEIEYIKSYVYILNLRNDYVITLSTEIPPEFLNNEIPKMTLQPLIENAFIHAVEPEAKDAVISVSVKISQDKTKLLLCVRDFGCGMSETKLKEITDYLEDDSYERDSVGSIGIKNIQQRLIMFYGTDYRIKIESEIGKGTIIWIPVPLSNSREGTL